MAKKPSFDTAVAARMLDDGLTTAEVAEALNVPVSTIRNFRTRHYSKQKPETDQPQELGAAPVDPPISGELPPDDDQSALPSALPEGPTPPPPEWLPPKLDPLQLNEEEARALYKLVGGFYLSHPIDNMDTLREFAKVANFLTRMDRIFGEEG